MAAYPSLNCDEVLGRVAAGTVLTIIYCVGIPVLMFALAVQFHRQRISSPFSVYLVRTIFAGHKATLPGMLYKIWTLLRSLSFVCISQSSLNDQQQAFGFVLLLTATMLLESILVPRPDHIMRLLDRFQQFAIFTIICLGMLHSGATRVGCYRSGQGSHGGTHEHGMLVAGARKFLAVQQAASTVVCSC